MKEYLAVIAKSSDASGLLAYWKEDRADGNRLLVLADWCDDGGYDDLAFCFRWMAAHDVRLDERLFYPPLDGMPARRVPKTFRWAWYRGDWRVDNPSRGVLPYTIFAAFGAGDHRYYDSEERAIERLSEYLKKIRLAMSLEKSVPCKPS